MLSRYVQARTGKGDLGVWRRRLGRGDGFSRLWREGVVESGDYLVLECTGTRGLSGWDWRRWVVLDNRSRWAYDYEEGGKVREGDRAESFFAGLHRKL